MRVLVVEDDATIANFVATGLRQEGYAVDVADNGVDGLDKARDATYDAAVVDVMLPRLDGLSLVAALRRRTRPADAADAPPRRHGDGTRLGRSGRRPGGARSGDPDPAARRF